MRFLAFISIRLLTVL